MPLAVLPTGALNSIRRTAAVSASIQTSPFTGGQQIQDWGGEWWEFDIDFWPQAGDAGRALSGFLTGLRGPITPFILRDPAEANSASLGSPFVNGGSQIGRSLVTSGWNASQTVLMAGQFFQLGTDTATRMYQVTEDVISDGSGNATLNFWPSLRQSPADSDPIETANPGVVVRLQRSVPTDIAPHASYAFSVRAREEI